MQRYKKYFKEASFSNANIVRAIELTNKLVGRRAGKKLYSAYTPEEFINGNGKFAGIEVLISGMQRMRYNWKMGASSELVSVDFWLKPKKGVPAPDYTIDIEGISAPKTVGIIADILSGNIEAEYQIMSESTYKEDAVSDAREYKGKTKSKEILRSIKQWAIDKDITDDKLQNTRIKDLWRDFDYWFKEIAGPGFETMSDSSFRNYILKFMTDRGITNIYMRTIKVKKGTKEKLITTDNASEVAYDNISHLKMSLNDVRNFMEDSLRGVTRGYMNSLIICGQAGFGKTTATNKILKEEGMKVEVVNTIKNLSHLYNLLSQNNNKKSVLLFDDCNEVFAKKYIGLVNAALDDHDPRIINFPIEAGKSAKKFNPHLEFVGKVVILTNTPKKKIPKAMTSRTVPIEVTSDNQSIIDDIRVNLANVMPDESMEAKLMVLDFIEKLGKNVNQIDFRTYKRAFIFLATGSPDWKKQVYNLVG